MQKFFDRFFYIVVPLLSWFVILMPFWLSPFHPAVVSYFIIAFALYFFYKAIKTVYFAVIAYQKINRNERINFSKKIEKINKAKKVKHYVVIPNYKESLEKLEKSIEHIKISDYPFKNNLNLILAFEDRESGVKEKANYLKKKYRSSFKEILTTFHPLMPYEEPGKASNQAYACRMLKEKLEEENIDFENVIITICDADSLLPVNYFSYLTYSFLKDKDSKYHFWAGPVILYGNYDKLPFFIRVQSTISSILRIAFLEYKDNFIQISTYSTSLWLLEKVNFWDVDVIPEDWHIYFQAFFKFGEKVKTIPLYTVIIGDAVYSGSLISTSISRYLQEKRWAWGVTDVGYALKKFFETPDIPTLLKLKKILFLVESHLLWPTTFFILSLAGYFPPLLNPNFGKTVLGFLLPRISATILTLATFFLFFYIYLDSKIRKEKLKEKKVIRNVPFFIIQWYFLPLISFFFSSLPALEAHTRVILGKKIKYQVTKKA